MSRSYVTDKQIIEACKDSLTMAEACSKVGMHFNTFKSRSAKLGIYTPNQGAKGTSKVSSRAMTRERFLEEVCSGQLKGLSGARMKSYLFRFGFKENKCEICGQPPLWNNKPLALELDHIDGDHYNNKLENLRIICPHCHSQTETFRAKNKKMK